MARPRSSPALPAPETIQALVLDLDGTLYDATGIGFQLVRHAPWAMFRLRNIARYRKRLAGQDHGTRETYMAKLAESLVPAGSVSSRDRAISWYQNGFYALFVQVLQRRFSCRPGLADWLKSQRSAGRQLLLASDHGHVRERLEALSIDPTLFDGLMAMEDEGCQKPAARPVAAWLSARGLAPEQAVVIGDRVDTDQGLAKALGAPFLGISDRDMRPAGFVDWDALREALRTSFDDV